MWGLLEFLYHENIILRIFDLLLVFFPVSSCLIKTNILLKETQEKKVNQKEFDSRNGSSDVGETSFFNFLKSNYLNKSSREKKS